MAEGATTAGATPLLGHLPDDIVLWEILVRLDPISLLRCRAVRRAWCCATSTRRFLLAHHARQPVLAVVSGCDYVYGVTCHDFLAFDQRAGPGAELQTVTRLDEHFDLEASCDGLLVLSNSDMAGSRTFLSICNPATRQLASLGPLPDFNILGMYPHRLTGKYRLVLQGKNLHKGQIGLYVFALGSNQPPRYIGWSGTKLASAFFGVPAWVRDRLHWYPLEYEAESELLIAFDTIAESFWQMGAPVAPTESYIFEMDDTIGISSCNKTTEIVDIWVLQNYESEVWVLKYRVELPMARIRWKFKGRAGDGYWYVTVAPFDDGVLLLANFDDWLFYIDTDGKLVDSFEDFYICKHRLKQTLVPHDFFTALEGYVLDDSPFVQFNMRL